MDPTTTMTMAPMGDAVAFSATARGRAPPFCLLRVERRRSERASWERVLDEAVEVHKLNFVTQLERHRYEYRLALRHCDDPSVLALPPELRAPRIRSGSGGEHPYIGSFRLVTMQPMSTFVHPPRLAPPSKAPSTLYLTSVGTIIFLGLVLRIIVTSEIARRISSLLGKASVAVKRWWLNVALKIFIAREIKESASAAKKEAPFADEDDDGSTMQAEKELLMTELPEFNDEVGWRDFFDSQIYRSEAHPMQIEGEEESSSNHRSRMVVSEPKNGSDAMRSARSTRIVPANAKISGMEHVNDQGVARNPIVDSPSMVMGSRRIPDRGKHRAETANHPQKLAVSLKEEEEKLRSARTNIDDFGEFWQM